jgi:hypothetical protein
MLTRTRRRALVALVSLAAVPLLLAATRGSRQHAVTVSCGQTITVSTTLSADVGPCGSDGVTIDADHVTLNLNGRRILGTGTGIGVFSGHNDVVVENGAISRFGDDVELIGDSSRVTNMRLSAAGGIGAFVTGTSDVLSGNRVFGNGGNGIAGVGPGSQYTSNVFQSNGMSGLLATDAASISSNRALSNTSSGITLENTAGGSVTVSNNVVDGNHLDGIAAGVGDPTVVTLSGNKAYFNGSLGISTEPGVIDGGTNKADSNGTSTQCTNIVCS